MKLPEIICLLVYTRDDLGTSPHVMKWQHLPDEDLKAAIEFVLDPANAEASREFGKYDATYGSICHDEGYFLDQMLIEHPELKLELPQTIEAFVDLIH